MGVNRKGCELLWVVILMWEVFLQKYAHFYIFC